jgi:WD40 repeat protein
VVVSADSNRELRAWRVDRRAAPASLAEVPLVETLAPRDDDDDDDDDDGGGEGGRRGAAVVEDKVHARMPDGTSSIAPLIAHETSISGLAVCPSTGDIWTASADNTAKRLSRAASFAPDAVLPHPDHVRAVAVAERAGLVFTACRDEGVRAWDADSGELVAALRGAHWEEVTSAIVVGGAGPQWVVSAGIDGTVRRWEAARQKLVEEAARMDGPAVPVEEEEAKPSLMTEDEERELAELMDDSD